MQSRIWMDGLTDVGNIRANNEDSWWCGQMGGPFTTMEPALAPLLWEGGNPALILVSDGVGGENAGEIASQMAVNRMVGELAREAAVFQDSGAAKILLEAMTVTNAAILAKAADPGFEAMGATLSVLCLTSQTAFWAQVGDSRIYLFRDKQLRQVSRDHSPVGRLRQKGQITEAEARRHRLRNQIDQSLGDPIGSFKAESGGEEIRPGDIFLLCSDGLSDGLWDAQIAQILGRIRRGEEVRPAVRQLVGQAKQASGRDNITAVIAYVEAMPVAASHRLLGFFRGIKDEFRGKLPKVSLPTTREPDSTTRRRS